MRYRNYSITNVGKVRSANEDNYGDALTPNGHIFVVCDGMGGHVGGAMASSIAVASIIEYFQREKHSNIIQAIDRAFSFANEQIFANALSSPELKGMGTTAVVLIISGEDSFIGHVGDSRIYLKSNNRLHRITKDHSFVQTLVDSGVISDEEAESHPNKNQILKALGTSPVVEGTICQVPLQVKSGDVFLLCSDGLNGMVNDRGLEMMLQGQNLTQSGEDLIRAALDAGGLDNVTATMVAIEESTHTISKFVDYNPIKKFDGSSTQAFMMPPNSNSKSKIFSIKNIFILSVFVLFLGTIGFVLLTDDDPIKNDVIISSNEDIDTNLISTLSDSNEVESENTKIITSKKVIVENKTKSKDESKTIKKDSLNNKGNEITMKFHKVEKNQNLKQIFELCRISCPTLTIEKLKSANSHQKAEIKVQIESETEPIKEKTKLNIPCSN